MEGQRKEEGVDMADPALAPTRPRHGADDRRSPSSRHFLLTMLHGDSRPRSWKCPMPRRRSKVDEELYAMSRSSRSAKAGTKAGQNSEGNAPERAGVGFLGAVDAQLVPEGI